jgi:hypothetical protein
VAGENGDVLAKTGSEGPPRKFAFRMRELARENALPGYQMQLTTVADGSPALHFLARSVAASRRAVVIAERDDRRHRDAARTAWLDCGGDPRTFDEAWENWAKAGNDPAAFADVQRSIHDKQGRSR